MISFESIENLFSFDAKGKRCIEIRFLVKGYLKYQSCWMGKMPSKERKGKEIYWYGLVPDSSEAYDYDNFQDFSSAPVFEGKSLKELWKKIEILSIDGCDPEERFTIMVPMTDIQEVDESGILYLDNQGNSTNISYFDAYKGWCKNKKVKKSKPKYICDKTESNGCHLIFHTNPKINFYADQTQEKLLTDIINKIELQGFATFDLD